MTPGTDAWTPTYKVVLQAAGESIPYTGLRFKQEPHGPSWSVDLPGQTGSHFTRHGSKVTALKLVTPDGPVYDNFQSGPIPDLTSDSILGRFLRRRRAVCWATARAGSAGIQTEGTEIRVDILALMRGIEDIAIDPAALVRIKLRRLGERAAFIIDRKAQMGLLLGERPPRHDAVSYRLQRSPHRGPTRVGKPAASLVAAATTLPKSDRSNLASRTGDAKSRIRSL